MEAYRQHPLLLTFLLRHKCLALNREKIRLRRHNDIIDKYNDGTLYLLRFTCLSF